MNNTNHKFLFLQDKRFIVTIIFLYIIIEIVYGLWNNSTWDDDCASRYYNTLNALNDFKQFVSLWNRPLFVLIFFLPVLISKYSILILMVAISAWSSYYLYKGVKKTGAENALLVVPLMLFQAFYFGVSRNGEVEPLAVAIISLGFYCYVTDKMFWFAWLGALLPLSRLELSPALFIWVIILIQKKKYKYIFIIPSLTLLWSIIGGLTENHFSIWWLFNQVVSGEKSENIYGHQTFGHYFQSYPYIVGPVVFFLLFIGLAERFYRRKVDLFVVSQFILIFFIYVIFSWKLNVGNATGFLRNLIPLTPLAAIISLNGFNYLVELIRLKKVPVDTILTSNLKHSRQNFKSSKQKKESINNSLDIEVVTGRHWMQVIRYILYTLIVFTLYYFFFSFEILNHHSLSTTMDYLYILTLFSALFAFATIWFIFRGDFKKLRNYAAILVAVFCICFTVVTEHPGKNINAERIIVEEFSDLIADSYLKNYKIYANHIWFFWSNDLNRNDSVKYGHVTKMNLLNAPYSSIVVWEEHYCNLGGDVDLEWLRNNKEFIELYYKKSIGGEIELHIFQKVPVNLDSVKTNYETFIRTFGKESTTYLCRGILYFKKYLSFDEALMDLDEAIEIDSNFADAYFQRGVFYFNYIKDFNMALLDFNKSIEKDSFKIDPIYNKGLCLANLNRIDEAIQTYTILLSKDSSYKNAYLKRGTIYYTQNKFTLAIDDFSKVVQLDPVNSLSITTRGLCYFNINNYPKAISDFTRALELNLNEVKINYYRAKAFYASGNYKSAMDDYNILINAKPGEGQLYFERGEIFLKIFDYKNAYSDLQRALNLGYPVSKNLLLQCKAAITL